MKVYIGFSVDMDRAYSDYNIHGQIIYSTNKHYQKYNTLKDNFIKYSSKLLKYFKEHNYEKSVTWYVNEADYRISIYHDELLKKCCSNSELGLHTHLNSKRFSAEPYNMSSNRNKWENIGIKEPNKRINKYINYNNFIYKAGNHIRNDVLFNTLADNLFSIDTTMDINNKNFEGGYLFYDDTNIPLGSEPFLIHCKNRGVILEIPEIRVYKVLEHIKKCETLDNLCFIKLQIHHWQYDELIPEFDKLIKQIQEQNHKIEFVDLRTMQKIYFKKQLLLLEQNIQNQIRISIPDDTYYMSLKRCISNEFLEVAIWLFNFYDKRSKIIELFAGIGQCSLFLHDLGFNNLTICDFDSTRCNFYNIFNKYPNIQPLVSDYYDVNLNTYDICFFGNSINSSLCHKLDIQVLKYQEFIDTNKILIIHEKYGSGLKEFKYLLDNLKNYTIVKTIGSYYIIKKTDEFSIVQPFSQQFKTYNTIAFTNIEHTITINENIEVIKITLLKDIMTSAGIFFPLFYINSVLQEKIYNCKLVFDIKIDKINPESKIKVYTGIKWVIIDTELTHNFQTIELIDDFDFFKPSTYRIGFKDIENSILYIKNISININD